MRIDKLIEGLQIIAKTQPRTAVSLRAGIFAGEYKPEEMVPEDVKRLRALGWSENEESWYREE